MSPLPKTKACMPVPLQVPYMLAYAQAEGLVRFHAILRERPGELQRLHPHEINANTVYGRIQLLTCAFHIFRILEVMHCCTPMRSMPVLFMAALTSSHAYSTS